MNFYTNSLTRSPSRLERALRRKNESIERAFFAPYTVRNARIPRIINE